MEGGIDSHKEMEVCAYVLIRAQTIEAEFK